MKHATRSVVRRAFFAVVAFFAAATGNAEPARADAMSLLEASGFDGILRADAGRDGKLTESLPEFLPPGLRTEMVRAIDQSMAYAGMRRSMAGALSARLDPATVDQQLRWWTSTSGKSVSAAQVAAFRELLETGSKAAGNPPSTAALEASSESPFVALLPKLVGASQRTRECLRMSLAFRRICADAVEAPVVLPAGVLIGQYSTLSDADLAAYRAYLKTPGARESMGILADAYLRTRTSGFTDAQRIVEAALARFAREKIGDKSDSDAMLNAAISRIDEGDSLDEVNLMLHLLRSLTPRDPRVFVELSRVSIKRGALNRRKPVGQPGPVDPGYLEDAQSWMDRAIALEPARADTLVLAGHLAYLKYEFSKSISLLEQARAIGTENPWLALNLADVLWADAQRKNGDRALMRRAALELSAALEKPLSDAMRRHANYSLAQIYAELHDLPNARAQFERLVAQSAGPDKRSALDDYAFFLFITAKDLDGSIAAARQASTLDGFGDDGSFLAQVLLVKAEKLYAIKQAADAARLVKEARIVAPGIERNYSALAFRPPTLPAVFALQEAGLIGDLSSSEGGLTLVYASGYASAADVERLIRGRADPNYLDPEEGTPLDWAIATRNLPALKVLLAHGADMTVKDHKGMLPLEYAEMIMRRTDSKDVEILATLRSAVKGGSAAAPVGGPLKAGYVYQALKKFSGDRYGHDLEVGTRVTFQDFCHYSDPNLECLKFRHPTIPGAFLDVALEKVQLVTWQEWLKEIGPAAVPSR